MLPSNIKLIVDFALGDGWIGYHHAGSKSPYLRIEHSQKQIFYAQHKEQRLLNAEYELSSRLYTPKTGKNVGKFYYQVNTRQHKDFDTARKWIYNKNKKTIDRALLRNLDSESLAYLFMDDGSAKHSQYNINKDKSRTYFERPKTHCYRLATMCFSYDENLLLLAWLKEKFDIIAKIERKYNSFGIIIFGTENKDKFRSTISPYITEDMLYKIQAPHTYAGMSSIIVVAEQTERENSIYNRDATVENISFNV